MLLKAKTLPHNTGLSSNGRTRVFGTRCQGSNPCSPATQLIKAVHKARLYVFYGHIRFNTQEDVGMRERIEALIIEAVKSAQQSGSLPEGELLDAGLEKPQDVSNGDFSSTVALKSAKLFKKAPRQIAEAILAEIPSDDAIQKVEIAGPGFINFYLSHDSKSKIFTEVREHGLDFARSNYGNNQKVQIEYVSANPVGPMHVGHGRWAALGDSLANVFDYVGYDVQREFYINDAGSQMDTFGKSIELRYLQLHELVSQGKSLEEAAQELEEDRVRFAEGEGNHPYHDDFVSRAGENAYGGDYIITLAQEFYEEVGETKVELDHQERLEFFREEGYQKMLSSIKQTLQDARAHFDCFFSERSLHTPDESGKTPVEKAIERLREIGDLEEKDGALYFLSTKFGDDKDRVLVKSDGSYTYFASDVAYHKNKFERGFERVIDIWGADHHGYIKRVDAACESFGYKGQFEVLLGQLVNLLRDGNPVRMSKRKGTMYSVDELLEEVGVDATRYNLLSRSSDQEIDFDIELAKKQSSENPVYYVQYAHARICSILRRAAQDELDDYTPPTSNEEMSKLALRLVSLNQDLRALTDESEVELMRKLASLKELLESAARDRAPFRLTHFAQDLASAYHQFYQRCQVITEDKELTQARLALCDSVRICLELVLKLIGVSAPLEM